MDHPRINRPKTTKKSNRQITSRGQLDDEIDDFIDLFVGDYQITSQREIQDISNSVTRRLVRLFESNDGSIRFKQLDTTIRREFIRSQFRTFPDIPGSMYLSSMAQIAEEVGRYEDVAKDYGITSDGEIRRILGFATTQLVNELNTTGIIDYGHLRQVVEGKYLDSLSLLHRNTPMRKIQSRIAKYEKTQRYVTWKLGKLRQAEAKFLL